MRKLRHPQRAPHATPTVAEPTVGVGVSAEASIVESFTQMYEANERLFELLATVAAERDSARDVSCYYAEQIAELRRSLEACMLNDGTARYEFGEPRCRDAQRPRAGSRWNTPHEIAKAALS